jgi:hypothetical protein
MISIVFAGIILVVDGAWRNDWGMIIAGILFVIGAWKS